MPRKIEPYIPRPEDLAWWQNIFRIARDGGMIGTSTGSYRLDKTNKTVWLTAPADPFNNPMTLLLHHRHFCVLEKLGWTLEPPVDWYAMELPDREIEAWETEVILPEILAQLKKHFCKGL